MRLKHYFGFLICLLLVILILIFALGGHGKSSKAHTPRTIDSYAQPGSSAVMIIDGPEVADSNHQEIKITVSSSSVVYSQINGYNNDVVNTKSYSNTLASYKVFLSSLTIAGYAKGNSDPSLANYDGYCALGARYIFQFNDNGQNLQQYWATNCLDTAKTYKGNLTYTISLFENQVPDFSDLTSNLNLYNSSN